MYVLAKLGQSVKTNKQTNSIIQSINPRWYDCTIQQNHQSQHSALINPLIHSFDSWWVLRMASLFLIDCILDYLQHTQYLSFFELSPRWIFTAGMPAFAFMLWNSLRSNFWYNKICAKKKKLLLSFTSVQPCRDHLLQSNQYSSGKLQILACPFLLQFHIHPLVVEINICKAKWIRQAVLQPEAQCFHL